MTLAVTAVERTTRMPDVADRAGQRRFVETGSMFDVETERSELGERALRKRVDHEHLHGAAEDTSAAPQLGEGVTMDGVSRWRSRDPRP